MHLALRPGELALQALLALLAAWQDWGRRPYLAALRERGDRTLHARQGVGDPVPSSREAQPGGAGWLG